MGRKMKGTKSGKFVNPTDQARKEARKRELRKNKKQRLIVRTAVLKGKDPYQIIADLERLDKMEYDFTQSSALNEKVLKDKRRKLKETWDRLCRLYVKDDKDRYSELKRLEAEYDAKRNELVKEFEAVKSAQEVSIEDIPLPSLPIETDAGAPSAALSGDTAPTSILKQSSVTNLRKKSPPGCPQGAPPLLLEFEETESDESEDEQEDSSSGKKRIRFSDEPKVDNENNLKEFLKEIEQLEGDKNEESNKKVESAPPTVLPSIPTAAPSLQLPPRFPPPPIGNNPQMFPGPSRPLLQPAPPVSLKPMSNLPPPMPLSVLRPPHLPPFVGPPRGGPPMPSFALPGSANFNTTLRVNPNPNHSLQLNQPTSQSTAYYQRKSEDRKSQVTTISAKPQLRNLSADATKFMPLALRLNRQGTTQKKSTLSNASSVVGYGMVSQSSTATPRSSGKDQNNSKDDAYADFMKELSGFMQE